MKRLWMVALLIIAMLVVPAIAQDDDDTTIEFTGEVTIVDETTIEVAGLVVDISSLDEDVIATLEDGLIITISGNMEGTVVIAINAETEDEADAEATEAPEAEATAEATPETTPEPEGSEVDEEGSEASDTDDDDVNITIVIEGPVSEIEGNIVVIYGFNIALDEDDPRLTVIAIGDVLRIEGEFGDSEGGTIIIIALFFDFINIEVYVLDGNVWRDSDNCVNPPPPWAPAHGWRARCETNNTGGGSGGKGRRGGSS